jgi:hypothetical protein
MRRQFPLAVYSCIFLTKFSKDESYLYVNFVRIFHNLMWNLLSGRQWAYMYLGTKMGPTIKGYDFVKNMGRDELYV